MEMQFLKDTGRGDPKNDLMAKKVLNTMEKVIDDKIEELDMMNNSELERLREDRIRSMKQMATKTNELLSKGHGTYEEVEEKLFFKVSTESDNVVAHFYTGNLPMCDTFHMHLRELAKTHVESRFIRVNAEKSPFLVSRLNIKRFPTIVIIIDGVTTDRIVGTGDFGEKNEFTREAFEWRLSLRGGIKYEGEFNPISDQKARRTQIRKVCKNRTIRENDDSSSEDD